MAVKPSSALPADILPRARQDLKPLIDENEKWEVGRNDKATWQYPWPGPLLDGKAVSIPLTGKSEGRNRRGYRGQYHPITRVVTASSKPAQNFTDIFYGRVQLNPSYVDFGAVLSAQTREVELWNATFDTITITSIEELNATGADLQFDKELPFTLRPLQAVKGLVSASPSGPSRMDARFVIRVAGGVLKSPTMQLLGSRSVVFAIAPDTSKPYLEKLTWITDIGISYDGTEQRISLSDEPDVQLTMTVQNQGRRAHLMDSFLWGWQDKIYSVPMWHLSSKLTQKVFLNENTVFCDTAEAGFKVGGIAMLWMQDNRYEVQEIVQVNPTSLVFKERLLEDWPKGCLIMACRGARLPAEVQSTWVHADLATHTLNFVLVDLESLDGTTYPNNAGIGNWSYLGIPILLVEPNRVSALTERTVRDLDVFETQNKARFSRTKSDTPYVVRSFDWFLHGRARMFAFRRWLYSRRGCQLPFWAPSWKADMKLAAPTLAGSPNIEILNIAYQSLYLENSGRKHIIIFMKSGGSYLRQIISAATGQSNATEILVLNEVSPVVIRPEEVGMICFLSLYRHDADEVELDWRSDKLILSSQTMRLLPDVD